MRQRYDNAAKFVTLGYPKPFTEHILEYPDLIVLEELATEQITLKTHHTDSTLKVQFPDEVAILHNEVQTHDSREPMQFRFAGYGGFLIREYQMSVYCSVLYLHPRAGLNDPGFYAYRRYGCEYRHQYRVVRLIEIEGQSILELQEPGLLPLTPLMKPPSEMSAVRWLEKCVETTAISGVGSEDVRLLLAALGIFGSLIYDKQLIEERLPEGIMQESPFFQEYVQQAEARGLERGLERGRRTGAIDAILTLLSDRFQPEAVQALKPRLETIEDLERLKALLREAPRAQSLEAFTQDMQKS